MRDSDAPSLFDTIEGEPTEPVIDMAGPVSPAEEPTAIPTATTTYACPLCGEDLRQDRIDDQMFHCAACPRVFLQRRPGRRSSWL